MDEILKPEEIFLQDVVFSVVSAHPDMDDVALYNLIIQMTDIDSFSNVEKILDLIRINKKILST